MKTHRRIFIPTNKTYGYELWLLQNGFRSIKIRCFTSFSIIEFFDEEEYLLFKLKGAPDIPLSYDEPDSKFINQLRKKLGLYSEAEPLELTITLTK